MASNRVIDADNDIVIKGIKWPSADGSANQVIKTDGAGNLSFIDQSGGTSGAAGINHINNPSATEDTSGYSTYADAAAVSPVDGTAGSANITFTRNTSNPLRGTGDFKITKDAVNRQGEGVSNDFNVDITDKARTMLISFDYDASHSGYANGDIKIFIYDATNTNLIRVNGEDLKAGKGTHFAQFQTAHDSISYRLIFHIASTNAAAYNVFLDEVRVSPISLNNSVSSKAVYVVASGCPGTFTITPVTERIPFTIVEDTTNSMSTTDNGPDTFTAPETGSYTIEGNIATALSTVTTQTVDAYINGTLSRSLQSSDSATDRYKHFSGIVRLNKGDVLDFRFSSGSDVEVQNSTTHHYVHIEKLANLSLPESVYGGRDIVGIFNLSADQNITTNNVTKVQFDTVVKDTVGAFVPSSTTDNTTGFYEIPESGFYDVSVGLEFNGMANGDHQMVILSKMPVGSSAIERVQTQYIRANTNSVGDNETALIATILELNKGDKIFVFTDSDSDTNYDIDQTSVLKETYFNIAKRNSSTSQLDTTTTALILEGPSSSQNLNAGQDTLVDWNSPTKDTHGAWDSVNNKYVVPVTGYYSAGFGVVIAGEAAPLGQLRVQVKILKNGSEFRKNAQDTPNSFTASHCVLHCNVFLDKGDEIKFTTAYSGTSDVDATNRISTDPAFTFASLIKLK